VRAKKWASLAVAAGTLAGVAALPATTAQAAPTAYTVHVGGDRVVDGVVVEGMRFMAPSTFAVAQGDTITFVFDGFHTATLLPDDTNATDWRDAHQAPLSGDYSTIVADTDDGAGKFQFNPLVAFPSDSQCGAASAPCDYDGKSVVNSGLPNPAVTSFTVTINDQPGSVIWVVCLIHPDMNMKLQVVNNGGTPTAQTAVDQYRTDTLASENDGASALIPKLETPTHHKAANGKVYWDAYAGFDQDGYALDGMFPTALHIKKGQRVRWHFSQLMGNIHTVTFPKKQAVALNGQFPTFVCEGPTGDTPASPTGPPCADPTALELEVPAAALLPAGGHTYAGKTTGMISSGFEGPGTLSQASYDVKFTATTGKKGFRYACIVHGGMMSGTVVVS
jgi:plastocyanin